MESDSDCDYIELDLKSNCAICLRIVDSDTCSCDISESDSYLSKNYLKLDCEHVFHRDCVVSWFIYSQNFFCPLCRHRNKKISLDTLNESNFGDKFKFNRFKTMYYKCNECEYECMCDDFIIRMPNPEHQRFLRRRNLRLELCKCCVISFFFFGLIISIVLIITNMYNNATPPNYSRRPSNITLVRRF